MKFRYLILLNWIFCLTILIAIQTKNPTAPLTYQPQEFNGPEQFILLHKSIRTPLDAVEPGYKPGYLLRELAQAKAHAARSGARTKSNGVIEWIERGPSNVPGRTRGLIVDPDDPSKNTWFAGSAGGGVWKTTNGGSNWTLLTPALSNLATTVLAMAESNHNIIYMGTGESFGGLPGIRGNGMFKSTDRGQSWNYLAATSGFSDINRIAVDPTNANILVAATSSGIYRTADGGDTWAKTSSLLGVEDLKVTPANFNIQYAAQNGVGIYKSIDAGITWTLANTGMSPSGRLELAVSPVNTNRVFASAEGGLSGTGSDLYISNDAGGNWSVVKVSFNNINVNFLGGQGWYDNTILCDPFDANVIYVGGVSLFRVQVESGSSSVNSYSVQELNTSFLTMVNFGAAFYGGRLAIGSAANASVEVRFGAGRTQKAHRFLVPEGATSGVPDVSYSYADYVDVPFEVWDVTNNRQLMVSFRDQDRNGQFNLLLQNTEGPATAQSREYIYINNVDYSASTPHPTLAVNGGHITQQMYFFWPVLAAGKSWPADITDSKISIAFSSLPLINATTITIADAYNQFDGKNRFLTFAKDVHPDHHNLVAIPMSASTYKILNASDGGIFVSNTTPSPGINQGDWKMVGLTYNTSQFYGADKRPGFDEYFGGMQDNGTWRSPAGQIASQGIAYQFSLGGDGFEVVWHKVDDKKLIGGSQGNNFSRSLDGGITWTSATSGLSGSHPFVSKLANSPFTPDVLYTLSSAGVFRSTDFGANWTLTAIPEKWGSASLMDVEVSRANANIVWAGSGMVNSGNLRNLHVSTNGGVTFKATNNYTAQIMGGTTKLASHPTEDSTAYALFSFEGRPKILRTKDLGESWEDISGFTGSTSTNGFPDVAVYCLYVRPDDPDIIWAGTEIGIVESLDNGLTWNLLNDFPNVSVWDMKGQDNQVVVATHGRGIWTAQMEQSQLALKNPIITGIGTSPQAELTLGITFPETFDSTWIYLQGVFVGKLNQVPAGDYTLSLAGVQPGSVKAKLVSYKGVAPFHSLEVTGDKLQLKSVQNQYFNYFNLGSDLSLTAFTIQPFGNANASLQSLHQYALNSTAIATLKQPIVVTNTYPFFFYRDVAIVEPGLTGSTFGQPDFKDYVVVEATKDGVHWIPLADGYNASFNASWLAAHTSNQPGSVTQFVDHTINLTTRFAVGDTLLFRFRLFSDETVTSWGWSVDDLYIQQEPTGIEESATTDGMELYPNPTTGPVTLSYSLSRPGAVTIQVVDLAGRVTQKINSVVQAGLHKTDLTIPSRGTHLIMIQTPDWKKTLKVIVRE